MCGRFTKKYTWAQIHEKYSLLPSVRRNLQPNYNVCPTTSVDVVARTDAGRDLVAMRWGLIPHWWSEPLKAMRLWTFNARAETVIEKSLFRDSFKKRRCLMPVSGYDEWHDTPEGRQPYFFTRAEGDVITVGAIQDAWFDKEAGETIRSCSMLITEPSAFVAKVHNRMPVVLERKDFEEWECGSVEDATALIRWARDDVLLKWPVSKRVNSSRASGDDPTLSDALPEELAGPLLLE
jgi:putative SOS response-associated peptidase YedK